MSQLINPYQYFLDIIAASRISSAVAKGAGLEIDIAKARYENLDISEVVFSDEQWEEHSGRWTVDIACKGRGYVLEGVKYTSGTLAPMVSKNAVEAVSDLLDITTPGFYSFEGKLYLIGEKGTGISDLLAMTGYEITEKHYSVVEFTERDSEIKADASVQIDYSFLKGTLYVTHLPEIVQEVVEDVAPPIATDPEPEVKAHDIDQLVEGQLDHAEPAAVIEETDGADHQVVEQEELPKEPVKQPYVGYKKKK